MKNYHIVLCVLVLSVIYALYFGSPLERSQSVTCKHSVFGNNDAQTKYSYIYSSMFFGCKQKDDKERFNYLPYFYNTSTGHLLCISGLHVISLTMLVFLLINFILYLTLPSFRIKGVPYFYISFPIGLIVSVLYVYFIGPEVPRLRAIIMLLFGAASLLVPTFRNKLFVLSLTASIILFFMPDSIYSYSFYYSFIAVLGIFLSSSRKTILICIAIYLFLTPLSLHSSGSFDINNILANAVVIPFFSFIYYPLNILFILLFVSGFHKVIYLMNFSTDILVSLLKIFSRISDFTRIQTFNLKTPETFILYAVLLLFFFSMKYKILLNRKNATYIYFAIGFISLSTIFYVRHEYKDGNKITNFELQKPYRMNGSGDTIFITSEGKNIIIDTGYGGFGTQRIIKEIKRKKIDQIDYLIITHVDLDHAGGVNDFVEQIKIKNIVISSAEYDFMKSKSLLTKTNFIFACSGTDVNISQHLRIKFLHPSCDLKNYKNRNQTVLAFVLQMGEYNFMFNSDIPLKGLNKFINQVPKDALVYQMSHHCNKKDNDSTLVNKLHPIMGFCTRDRRLLKKAILNSKSFKFPILMTGLCGDIKFSVDGSGLQVFSSKCPKISLQLKKT